MVPAILIVLLVIQFITELYNLILVYAKDSFMKAMVIAFLAHLTVKHVKEML